MSWLELPRVGPRIWERFQSLESIQSISHPVLDRWRRARSLGVQPEGAPESQEPVRGPDLRQRKERADRLLAAADQTLGQGEAHLARAHYTLLLTDAQGVILRSGAGGHFADTARRLHLIEGGRWAEQIQGTNAIGTALAERCPVKVFGDAHFVRSNHDLICYASPLFDPYGELIGVLDATSRTRAAHPGIQWAVAQAAGQLQEALRDMAWRQLGSRGAAPLLHRCALPALLIEHPGRVRAANDLAAVALGISPRCEPLEGICGLGWAQLRDHILQGQDSLEIPRWGKDERPHKVHLHPIQGQPGLPLGVWLFVEPRPIAPPPFAGGRGRRRPAQPEALRHFAPLLGSDPVLEDTRQMAARIAASQLPVLLLAETGTGKGLLARAIHNASSRARGPLMNINCGALTDQLLESELFGYAPGAFTGARRGGQEGRIHAATGGTLFLDEVAEMSPHLQAALLKVLEEGTYFRVGESQPRKADFRLICATCRDLEQLVAQGRFRSDLYYRIRGATLSLPTLQERADVLELTQGLLARLCQESGCPSPPHLSPEALRAIAAHPWPGNVRELRMALQYALAMSFDGVIELEDLPADVQGAAQDKPRALVEPPQEPPSLQASKKDALLCALRDAAGNVSEAARRLGVARSTVYRMMRRHDIQADAPTD